MFDSYTLKARLWPALITGLPSAGASAVVWPGVEWWHAGLAGTGAAIGLTFLLAQMARSAGKRKETDLFRLWGGKPTTLYLRHRTSPLDKITLARYHANIVAMDPAIAIPTSQQEADDPANADAIYEAATRMLINRTRDTKRFTLLFRENIHYGFCRNLWGLKPLAIVISVASALVVAWPLCRAWDQQTPVPASPVVMAILCLACLCFWCFWFTPSWVKVAADGYAERLLEASDELREPRSTA